jgi:PAS domain S-box-containing protein
MENYKQPGYLTGYIFLLIFVLLAAGIATGAYFAYKNYEKKYRFESESQLSTVAKLKVDQLIQWRKERLGDGQVFFKNDLFSAIVKRYIRNHNDQNTKNGILTWVSHIQSAYKYDLMLLLDAQLNTVLVFPENKERTQLVIDKKNTELLLSGNIAFQDFYRNDQDQHIYLKILVPILEDRSPRRLIAVLALRISPEDYLFPLIQEWPIPSRTAETLIIRREGDNAEFLNELRFQKNTALNFRIPIGRRDIPAVKAALGQEGIVEGIDYRGVPVIADVRAVPGSPWFLVARIDTEEVYGPLKERMWLIVSLVGALFIAAGTGVGFIWRYQRSLFYQKQYKSAEALRESEQKFRTFFEHSSSALAIIEKDTTISMVNKEYCKIGGYEEKDVVGTSWTKQIVPEDLERLKEYNRKRLLDPKNAPDSYEFKFYRKDGQIRNALMSAAFIPTSQKIICSFTDITERKQAEEQIRRSEERFKSLVQILQYDSKTTQDFLDYALGEAIRLTESKIGYIYFYHEDVEKFVLNTWSKDVMKECTIVEPQTCYELDKTGVWGEAVRQRKPIILNDFQAAHPLKKGYPEGHAHLTKFMTVPVFKKDQIVAVVGVANKAGDYGEIDVLQLSLLMDTVWNSIDNRKTEEQLRKLSYAIEQSPASIVITNTNGEIEYVNPKFIKITGYSLEEAKGKNPRILKSGETPADEYSKLWNKIISGDEWHGEFHNKKKNGELYWESAVISPIKDIHGVVTHFLAVKEDITERKLAEEALRKSSETVQLLLNSTAEAIYGLDINGLCTFNNSACLKILGYERSEQFLGKNMHDLIHSKYADGTPYDVHQCPIFKTFTGSTEEHVDTEVLWRKDGTSFPSEYWSYPIRQDGELIGAVVTFLDITKRKHAEFELQKSAEAREILIKELQTALDNVKTLQGLIPICSNCKKIRDDKGFWNQVEEYVVEHTDAKFSHGLCPDCGKLLYGDLYEKAAKKSEERKNK